MLTKNLDIFKFKKWDIDDIKLLLNNNVSPNVIDRFGNSILYHAHKNKCSIDIIDLLLNSKANPNIKDKYSNSLLYYVHTNGNSDDYIKLLLEYDADPNFTTKNNRNRSVFYYFCMKKNPNMELIEYCIKKVVNIDSGNLLNMLCKYRSPSENLLKLLIDNKININIYIDNIHFIVWCYLNKYRDIVLLCLMNNNLNKNIQNKYGSTILHQICSTEIYDIEIIQLILDLNPNLNLLSNKKTSFDIACENAQINIIISFLSTNKITITNNIKNIIIKNRNDIDKKELLKIFDEYKLFGTIWNIKNHRWFLPKFKHNILLLLLLNKYILNTHIRMPKPILYIIIQYISTIH